MPELPEVETMRRGIAAIVGSRIVSVTRPRCRLRPIGILPSWSGFRRRVTGRTIDRLDRAGKRVVIRLDDGGCVVMEPRMTGLVLLADPPDLEHLRLVLSLSGGTAGQVCFWDRRGLGSVYWLSESQFARRLGPETLGPDALCVTADQLQDRLGASRREIKVALLDQRAVAGIGNLYACEILHAAAIHPLRRCSSLCRAQWQTLQTAIVAVLEQAVLHEGSTLSDGTYRNALNQSGSYQTQHRVYDREGLPCTTCGGPGIARIVQAQRSTWFCPGCQPRGRQRPGQ